MKGALWIAVLTACLLGGPAAQAQHTVFHTGDKITWKIHDISVYQSNKAAFDLYINRIEAANKSFTAWFGPHRAPIEIIVNKGGYCSVGPGTTSYGFNDTCIVNRTTAADQFFTRRVGFLFIAGCYFQQAMPGLPGADFITPLQRMVMVDLLGEQETEAVRAKAETDEIKTEPEMRKYQYYRSLKAAGGWTAIQDMLTLLKQEKIDLGKVGPDGSAARNAYVFAYLSLVMRNKKPGRDGQTAGITGLTPAGVADVLRARNLLRIADRKGQATTQAWTAFREGRLTEVKGLLPAPT